LGDIVIKIGKAQILLGLTIFTLILTLINSYNIFNLSNKLNSMTRNLTKNEQVGIRETQQLPSGNLPSNANQQQPSKIVVSIDDDPVKGSKNAPITIVEFSDFQCPFCARFYAQTLPSIEENYIKTGKVKFIYRDFPLNFHQYAQKAAEAAECADEQGKFWEYHDILFQKQSEWSSAGIEKLKEYAQNFGLDIAKFNECLDSGKYTGEVQKDYSDGSNYGVTGTPTFFINGIEVVGAQPYSVFEQIIEQELNKNG
jgi:protein-disulfide isomerase